MLRRPGDGDLSPFEQARVLGFEGVEVELARDDLRPAAGDRLTSLRRARDATGLAVPSVIVSTHVREGGLADRDLGTRARAADDVRVAIAFASRLGADVVLVPFFLRSAIGVGDALVRAAEAFVPLCAAAAAEGVTLCYEGTLPARDVRRLAERVASPAFACYFDLANPLVEGLDPATEIRALGSLIRRVHFKDALVRRGDSRPGLGRVDYAECARALAEIGYDGWIVLETPAAPPDVVAGDLALARSFFPGLAR